DEADEMLNMGFQEELNAILEYVPEQRQTLLFSATMPTTVSRIARNYMKEPTEITVGRKNAGAENVNHIYYMVHARDRYRALKRIVDFHPEIYGIVFCRTRADTKEVSDKLMQDGYSADALHGDLSQAQRDQVMGKFRVRNLQLLVATDVAARGLDVNDLTHVINYQLPDDDEIYTHRSGRTGRANKKGDCVSIAHARDHSKIRLIERQIGKKFDRRRVPTGQEICQRQLLAIVDKMMEAKVDSVRLDPLLEIIYEKVGEMDRETIIRNFVSLEFNRFLSYYKDARDLDVVDGSRRSDRDSRNNRRGGDRDRNSRYDRGGRDRNRSGGDRDRNRSAGDRDQSDRNRSGGDRDQSDRNRS
ncbi:DEAD/DEAH box helicase, partial [bacterium]|nr:DEAD/DEAH box helicase [bacterium]